MTTKRATTAKGAIKKLNIKKETLKDLDLKRKGKDVKGGQRRDTEWGTSAQCTGLTCQFC